MFNDDLNFTPFNKKRNLNGFIPMMFYRNNTFMLPPIDTSNMMPNEKYPSDNDRESLHSYNVPIKNIPNNNGTRILDSLRQFDLDLDENKDLAINNDETIDTIYKNIELYYPGTFTLLNSYDIPLPIAKLLIRRIIKLSIKYYNKEDE